MGGVFRSTDRGETWVTTNADPDPHVLHTHPTASGRMYEGGGTGYYATTDAGATWKRNLDGMPAGVHYFCGLAVDPADSDVVLLVGARDPYSGHAVIPGVPVWSSVHRLTNGTWQEVTAGLPPREGTAMGTLAAAGPGTFYYVTEPGELYRSRSELRARRRPRSSYAGHEGAVAPGAADLRRPRPDRGSGQAPEGGTPRG